MSESETNKPDREGKVCPNCYSASSWFFFQENDHTYTGRIICRDCDNRMFDGAIAIGLGLLHHGKLMKIQDNYDGGPFEYTCVVCSVSVYSEIGWVHKLGQAKNMPGSINGRVEAIEEKMVDQQLVPCPECHAIAMISWGYDEADSHGTDSKCLNCGWST